MDRRWIIGSGVLLLTVGFFLYGHTLHYPFIELDDALLITQNPIAQAFTWTNVKLAFSTYDPELYIPLTLLSYQLDATFGGVEPFFFHLQSLLLHILNAWLVFVAGWQLTRKKYVSLFASMLFLIHPIQVEAVVWASGRKDVLSGAFFLLSIVLYIHFLQRERWRSYAGSVGSFLLGLLAKISVISLAPLLFVIDSIEGKRVTKRSLLLKLPFFALAMVFGIVALFGKFEAPPLSPLTRILVSCTSLVFSLWKLLVPLNLSPIYTEAGEITLRSWVFLGPLLIMMGAIVFAVLLRRRWKIVGWGVAFVLLAYIPSFGNIMKGGEYYITTDRYAYIPMAGLAILTAIVLDGVQRMMFKRFSPTATRKFAASLALLMIGTLGVLAARQSSIWRDADTLSRHVIATAPGARIAHLWRANVLRDAGNPEAALAEYRTALSFIDDSQVHYNRALAYEMLEREQDALDEYRKAITLQPDYALAQINLGRLLYLRGEKEEARRHFEVAARDSPQLAMPFYNLGVLEGDAKHFDRAVEFYRKALKRDPLFSDARANLAIALLALGRTSEAIEELRQTLRDDPENPTALAALEKLKNDGILR